VCGIHARQKYTETEVRRVGLFVVCVREKARESVCMCVHLGGRVYVCERESEKERE